MDLSAIAVIAAIAAAIFVSIGIVQNNVLMLAAATAVAFAITLPVEVSLGLFAILVPFDQILVLGDSGVTLTWIAGAFAGATLILYGMVSGRFRFPPHQALCWGLFVLWAAASVVWANDPSASLAHLPTVVSLFAVYIVAASFQITERELSRITLLAIVGGIVAASMVIFQFAHDIDIEGRATLVLGQLQSNPNDLAGSLLLPFSLAIGCGLLRGSRLKRTAMSAALGLITTSIFLLMSRGALIALATIVLVYMFRVGIRKRIFVSILVLAIPLLFIPDLFYQRLAEAPSGRGTGRYDIWLVALQMIKRHTIIGIGLANFTVAYPNVSGYARVFRYYVHQTHNMYLQVCAELGAVGLVLFLAAIWLQMRAVRSRLAISTHSSREHSIVAIEAGFWGLLVMGMSGDIEWHKAFWFSLILLALITQKRLEPQGNTSWAAWEWRRSQTA